MFKKFHEYLYKFREKYQLQNVIKYVVLLVTLVAVIDEMNLITNFFSSRNVKLYMIIAIGLGVFFIIEFFKYGVVDLIKLKIINKIDLCLVIMFIFSVIYICIKMRYVVLLNWV